MRETDIREKSSRFIVTLYLIADKSVGKEIDRSRVFEILGIHFDDEQAIMFNLARNKWVRWKNRDLISITYKGQIEAEKVMEATYPQREHKVLKAIYEMGNRQSNVLILIDDLAEAVEMSFEELNPILIEIETGKGLIDGINEAVSILPLGIETLEKNQTPLKSKSQTMQKQTDPKKVFVVHGRNLNARNEMFRFLRSIGLQPLEWSEAVKATGKGSPYVGEILDTSFSIAQAIIVLFTPDDEAKLLDEFINENDETYERELTPQARPNVIFEAGMAMGRNPDRTVLVELGKLRPFSDIYGRHVIRLNNSSQRKQEFAHRLETAGCRVNLAGTDWHTEGNFDSAIASSKKKVTK